MDFFFITFYLVSKGSNKNVMKKKSICFKVQLNFLNKSHFFRSANRLLSFSTRRPHLRNISLHWKSSCCHKIDCMWHLLSTAAQFDYSIKPCLAISHCKRRKCGQNYIFPANWVIRDRDHNGKLAGRSLYPQSMFNELCKWLKLYIRYWPSQVPINLSLFDGSLLPV